MYFIEKLALDLNISSKGDRNSSFLRCRCGLETAEEVQSHACVEETLRCNEPQPSSFTVKGFSSSGMKDLCIIAASVAAYF